MSHILEDTPTETKKIINIVPLLKQNYVTYVMIEEHFLTGLSFSFSPSNSPVAVSRIYWHSRSPRKKRIEPVVG